MKIDMEQFDPTDANSAMSAAEAYNILHDAVRAFFLTGYMFPEYPSWRAFPKDDSDKLANTVGLELNLRP